MKDKIKVAELFYSIQGEGKFMGVPSIFLRTFGCNFKCAGFGMPKGVLSGEADAVANLHDLVPFTEYGTLPLVNTGCDSYASWHPAFKNLSPMLTVDAIANRMEEVLPNNEWGDVHLVITGGEPLLGWQRAYPALLQHPKLAPLTNLTFETNGTQPIGSELGEEFDIWLVEGGTRKHDRQITFSVSPKLSASGEKSSEAIKPEVVCSYQDYGDTYLKFVVASEDDVNEALEVIQIYRAAGFAGHIYLMPVGGVESVYALNNRNVALLAMKHGLRYSDRLQVPLFKNAWAT